RRLRSAAVTPLAFLVGPDGAQEIDFAKGRPQYIGEIELAVRALPEQESGETDFATGSDDQIWVRDAGSVEMCPDRLGCDPVDGGSQRGFGTVHTGEQRAHSIGNFRAPAIGNGDIQLHAVIVGGGALGSGNSVEDRLGEHGEAADRAYTDAASMNRWIASK